MSKQFEMNQVPVYSCLPTAVSQEELDQCRQLFTTLRTIRSILDWTIVKPAGREPVTVHVWYTGGCEPRPCWNKWLWSQIVTDHPLFLAWIGRLSAMSPAKRELVFVPRPGRIDESMANQAARCCPLPGIHQLKLGVLSSPYSTFRTFPTFH